jgi:hypothetical protein
MPLTADEIDLIAGKVADELASRKRAQWVDPETHSDHHRHVAGLIQREADMTELRKKITYSACIWAVPFILLWVASAFWQSIMRAVQVSLK